MTRQTYDRAPRLTKLATAHISKGVSGTLNSSVCDQLVVVVKCELLIEMHTYCPILNSTKYTIRLPLGQTTNLVYFRIVN